MKTPEDEAFDELATRQGSWGGGFPAKRKMAADKMQEDLLNYGTAWSQDGKRIDPMSVYKEQPAQEQHWNEDEWRRNNWRCGHGWLRGEQCEICNAPQPPSEWAGIKAILDEYGLQAIDFVADFKAFLAQPAQEEKKMYVDRIMCGVSRAEWHDRAWELYQAKAFDDCMLPKNVSIHTLRTIFNATYDSFGKDAMKEALAQPAQEPEREALKLALEAYLCREMPAGTIIGDPKWWVPKIAAAIKEALAQPAQEPVCPDCKAKVLYECVACSSNNYPPKTEQDSVAWVERIGGGVSYDLYHESARKLPEGVKFDLYTAPPQRKPLTDEEIDAISLRDGGVTYRQLARAVEAAHNIGGATK